MFDPIFIQVSDIKDRFLDTHRFLSVYSLQPYLNAVAKRIVNVRFTKKEHLLRETNQKYRLHCPAQITQKKQDDVIKL